MTLIEREREEAYLKQVRARNNWFAEKKTVRLTHDEVEYLICHAFRAGLKGRETSIFEQLFGKGRL